MSGSQIGVSDYSFINSCFKRPLPMRRQKSIISYQNLKLLRHYVSQTLCQTFFLNSDVTELFCSAGICTACNKSISASLELHGPLKPRHVSSSHALSLVHTRAPDHESHSQLPWVALQQNQTVHSLAYNDHMQSYISALNAACSAYLSSTIHYASCRPKILFSTDNKL